MKLVSTLILMVFLLIDKPTVAQWLQTNGPFGGGAVTNMVIDSSNNIYASTGWSGFFRSTDGGASWTPINDGLNWPGGEIAVSPQGVLFANDELMIRSFDQGETWESCDNGLGRGASSIACNPQGHVYAAFNTNTDGEAALYVSENNGDSWTQIPVEFFTYMEWIQVAVNSSGHIFLGGPETLLRSTDNGSTWVNIAPQEGYASIHNICFDSTEVVYACATFDGGLFKSHDNGDIWAHILTEGTYCVAAQGDLLYAATNWGMRRSTDGGITWDSISNGLSVPVVYSTLLLDNGTVLAGSKGVYASENDGDSWEFSSEGMIASDVHQVVLNDEGTIFSVSDKVWRSADDGETWEIIYDSLDQYQLNKLEADAAGNLFLLVNSWPARMYKSTDDGDNWMQLSLPAEDISDFGIHPTGDIFLAAAGSGMYKSTDDGLTWALSGLQGVSLQSVFIDPQGIILACEQNSIAIIYRSADNGSTWSPVHSITMYGTNGINDYASDGLGFLYMATYNDLLRSGDAGLTWEVIASSMYVKSITANQFDTLYATTNDGIWQSPDQGTSWTAFNDGLPSWGMPETIAFSLNDGIVYTGWHGQGVWSYGSHTVDVNQPALAATRSNLQLYPNPSTDAVFIKVNGITPATPLKIFTPDGRLITTVITGADGRADISALHTGIYILNVDGITGKLVKN